MQQEKERQEEGMMYWLAAAECDPAEVHSHHTCGYEQPH